MFTFLTEDAVAPMAGGGSMIFMMLDQRVTFKN